jgi:DNA-binding transcriptional LysR family regulator
VSVRDNLDGVAVFVEAAEAGSFVRAAQSLALSRSAVGKAIARMEERLGVRLFQRTTRSQSLTEEGKIYYERCQRALAELRAGAMMLESGRKEVTGKIRISMPALFGRYCVAPVLLDLARRHPALELDMRFSDQLVDIISEGYDLAVRNHVLGMGSALQSRRIANQRKVICASPDYLALHGSPTSLADLVGHEALVYWHRGQIYPWTFLDAQDKVLTPQLTWRLQFDSYEVMADAAIKGMGIACLPAWLVHERMRGGQLVPLLQDVQTERFDTYVVWPAAEYQPQKLRVTIDALVEYLMWVDAL